MNELITINVTKSERIRIDELLREELPKQYDFRMESSFSNSKIRRLIISGNVFVNNKIVTRPSFMINSKNKVVVSFNKEKFLYEKQPDDIKFTVQDKDVLYEDENLIFINKPSFFPVEQTITKNRENLHEKVIEYLWKKSPEFRNPPYVGIMHRLDRETSGVILFTKNRQINKDVSALFLEHNFIKEYYAVCLQNDEYTIAQHFTVEMYMARVSAKSQKGKWGKVSKDSGQYSKTDFVIEKQIIIEEKKCFLVKCNLFTGRTHQIRVHLSSKNLPILGDTLYGSVPAKRMYLHAYRLCASTERLSFNVSAPFTFDT